MIKLLPEALSYPTNKNDSLQKPTSVTVKLYLAVCAAIAWLGILLQLYLIIKHRNMGMVATVIQFLSFFTILTNILVAICFTQLLVQPVANSFFTRVKTLAATAVYITVVAAIYNVILRHLWNPTGWQLLADNILHAIVPALFVAYWLFVVPKKTLHWKDSLSWLIYPLVYLIYTVIRGAITGLYPYPFADVTTYGYAKVLTNGAMVMVLFLVLSLVFIGIGKMVEKFRFTKENVVT